MTRRDPPHDPEGARKGAPLHFHLDRTATRATVCSCGCTKAHVIAVRETADEHRVTVWSDGSLSQGRFGAIVPGTGTPRSRYTRTRRAYAVRLVMDDFGACNLAEIPTLVGAAEATFKHTWSTRDDARRAAIRAISR